MADQPDLAGYAADVSAALGRTDFDALQRCADAILAAHAREATIFTAGNGGSSSTAGHFVNDLLKGCRVDGRPGFRAISLADPNAVLTCLANDFSYDEVFELQLATLARPGDLLVVFSGSGNSPNIVRACLAAGAAGVTVIAFLGGDGGRVRELSELCVLAPSHTMEQIEDLHLCYTHSLVHHLRSRLTERAATRAAP